MAGIDNPEEFLNAAKAERVERELTGILRKVFDAVPAGQPWTTGQVAAEVQRLTGSKPEHRVVQGVLCQLEERGLVKQPATGQFVRSHSRPQLAAVTVNERVNMAAQPVAQMAQNKPAADAPAEPPAEPAGDPLDRLAAVAQSLKDLGGQIQAAARAVEDVAIGVEERIQKIHADTEKLRQLQALLKSLGQ